MVDTVFAVCLNNMLTRIVAVYPTRDVAEQHAAKANEFRDENRESIRTPTGQMNYCNNNVYDVDCPVPVSYVVGTYTVVEVPLVRHLDEYMERMPTRADRGEPISEADTFPVRSMRQELIRQHILSPSTLMGGEIMQQAEGLTQEMSDDEISAILEETPSQEEPTK